MSVMVQNIVRQFPKIIDSPEIKGAGLYCEIFVPAPFFSGKNA